MCTFWEEREGKSTGVSQPMALESGSLRAASTSASLRSPNTGWLGAVVLPLQRVGFVLRKLGEFLYLQGPLGMARPFGSEELL